MVLPSKVSPLADSVPIVRPDGTPTTYFVRQLQQLLDEKANTDQLAAGAVQDSDLTEILEALELDDLADVSLTTPAQGDILYRDTDLNGWVNLPAGTSGQILQTNGVGANPSWQTFSSSGLTYTAYNVATAGDAFIDVLLDNDNGYAYDVIVKGLPSAISTWSLRMSDDNGATFKSGASDYKTQTTGAASSCTLSASLGTSRRAMVSFKLVGLNVVATENFALLGSHHSIDNTGNPSAGSLGASPNALGPLNYNAFRVLTSAGNMDAITVWVARLI